MRIRFLRCCYAPQQHVYYREELSLSISKTELRYFLIGDEIDPNKEFNKVNLTALMYKEDYEIIEYP